MEQEIFNWLKNDLKVNLRSNDLKDCLKNGFVFQEIFSRLGVHSQLPFINKEDDQCVFQNYLSIKEICKEKLGLTIKGDKNQKNGVAILKQIREQTQNQSQNKKSKQSSNNNEDLQQTFQSILKTKDKRLKDSFTKGGEIVSNLNLPPKILKIESQLEKFREEKLRHEIIAKMQKDEEDQRDLQIKMELRQIELDKLKNNKQHMQEITQKVYDGWKKNEEIKQIRLEKEKKFQEFMTQRLVDDFLAKKEEEKKDIKENLKYFKQNCQRQGIELKHDPEKVKKETEKQEFNLLTTMQQIRDRTHQRQKDIKERQKRKNRMLVEQEILQKNFQERKQEKDLLEQIFIQCSEQNRLGESKKYDFYKQQLVEQLMREKSLQIEQRRIEVLNEQSAQLALTQVESRRQRKQEYRVLMFQYKCENLEKKRVKREKHRQLMEPVIDKLLDLTQLCFQHQQENGDLRVDLKFWENLVERFEQGKPLVDGKVFKMFEDPSKEGGGSSQNISKQPSKSKIKTMSQNQNLLEMEFLDYYMMASSWRPYYQLYEANEISSNSSQQNNLSVRIESTYPFNNYLLADFLHALVDKIFPPLKQENKPGDLPHYLPIKIAILGSRLAGKKTVAEIIKKKYGTEIIEPYNVCKEAFLTAYPAQEEDDKKKKAAKKDAKIEEKKENPKMKEIGEKIGKAIISSLPSENAENQILTINEFNSYKNLIADEILVQAIATKIQELFGDKNLQDNQIASLYEEAENLEKNKLIEFQKQQEDKKSKNLKKAGKDTKKGKDEVVEQKSEEEILQELLSQPKQCPFTKGYILLDFPKSLRQAKLLEQRLSGYQQKEDRLNAQGEKKKQEIEVLVKGHEQEEKNELTQGGLDFILNIVTQTEDIISRAENRKIDPTTEIVYHSLNPAPQDPKLLERLKNYEEVNHEEIKSSLNNFQNLIEQLSEFYSKFGFQEIQLEIFQVINNNSTQSQVLQQFENLIEKYLLYKNQQFLEIKEKVSTQKNQESTDIQENLNQQENQEQAPSNQQISISTIFQNLSLDQLKQLMKLWDETQNNYQNDLKTSLNQIITHREQIQQRSIDVQNHFLQIIQRKDDKIYRILNFQENLNKFVEENPQVLKFSNAQQELINRLDSLYDNLWDAIEQKKNEAIEERKNIIHSGWIESEIEAIYHKFVRLFQIELNKITEIFQIFQFIQDSIQGTPINELQERIILDPFKTKEPPMEDQENDQLFPRVDQLIAYYNNIILDCPSILIEQRNRQKYRRQTLTDRKQTAKEEEEQLKQINFLNLYQNETLVMEQRNAIIRGICLKNNLVSRIKEIRVLAEQLYNRLDDWIIFGIKRENDITYDAIKQLRNAIESKSLCSITNISSKEIKESYRVLNFYNAKNIFPIMQFETNQNEEFYNKRFGIYQLKLILDELKSIADQQGNIELPIFNQFFTRRSTTPICSTNLPKALQKLSKEQLNSIIDSFKKQNFTNIQYTDIATCLTLLGSPIPNQNQIFTYQDKLNLHAESTNNEVIEIEAFIETEAWFDQTENFISVKEGIVYERKHFIKIILFSIYAENFKGKLQLNIQNFIDEIFKISQQGKSTYWDLLFQAK